MMRKILSAAIAVASLSLLGLVVDGASAAPRGEARGLHGEVWVTNKSLDTVTVFDASTGSVLGVIPVGHTPIGVTIPRGTHKAYVSNEGSNTVSVIDAGSLAVVKTIPMGAGPHHMMSSPDGRFVYVGEYNQNTVGVIATNTDTAVAHYVTSSNPVSKTHAVFVTNDGTTLFATNFTTKELVVLDAHTGDVQWRLALDGNPSEALVSSDRKVAYVSIRSKNSVAVIDLASRTVIAEPSIGNMPDTLQLTPDGKRLVVTLRGTPAQISVMEIPSLSVSLANLAGSTTGHHWLSASGRYSFVAIEGPGGLAVVDNETGLTRATFTYPGDGKPHGVFFWPSRGDSNSSD